MIQYHKPTCQLLRHTLGRWIRSSTTYEDKTQEYIEARFGQMRTLIHCCWECKFVQTLVKHNMEVSQKLKIELPSDPASPLLGIYPQKQKH